MSADTAVTADRLRHLFAEQGVVREYKDWRLPTQDGFGELAGEVEFLRHCHGRGKLIVRQAQETVVRALDEMISALPAMIATNIAIAEADRRRGELSAEADQQRERLTRLLNAAHEVADGGIGWRIFPAVETWHQYAVPLASVFRTVMRAANPGADLRSSNTGPVVRFLTAVIPLISGEAPTAHAVARWLQRGEAMGNTTKASVTT